MENVESFYEEYEDMFQEYLTDIKVNLKNTNEEYMKLKREYDKIIRTLPTSTAKAVGGDPETLLLTQ